MKFKDQYRDMFEDYLRLRDELDQRCRELTALHDAHLNCRAGCHSCCMAFSVLPIEFYYIKSQIGDTPAINPDASSEECSFLVNGLCSMYEHRPFICRTQGLPLLFVGEDDWELSVCELNFKNFRFEDFTAKNTFALDTFNSRLFIANKNFMEHDSTDEFEEGTALIPLKDLF